ACRSSGSGRCSASGDGTSGFPPGTGCGGPERGTTMEPKSRDPDGFVARAWARLASAAGAAVLLAVPVAALGLLRDCPWPLAVAGTDVAHAPSLPTYTQDFFVNRRATGPTPSPTAVARKSFSVPCMAEATCSTDEVVRCLRTPDLEVTVEVVPGGPGRTTLPGLAAFAAQRGGASTFHAVLTVRLRKKSGPKTG